MVGMTKVHRNVLLILRCSLFGSCTICLQIGTAGYPFVGKVGRGSWRGVYDYRNRGVRLLLA